MKVEWVSHSSHDVYAYFLKGFRAKKGWKVFDYEVHHDPMQQKVLFKLYLRRWKRGDIKGCKR